MKVYNINSKNNNIYISFFKQENETIKIIRIEVNDHWQVEPCIQKIWEILGEPEGLEFTAPLASPAIVSPTSKLEMKLTLIKINVFCVWVSSYN